jgi:hypothetical protein
MATLTDEGDKIVGRRIVYVARKVSGPRLVMKGGKHRGMEGVLYDAEAYIDIAVQKKRTD